MRHHLFVGVFLLSACAAPRPVAPPRAAAEPFVCQYRLNPKSLPAAALRRAPGQRPFARTKRSGKAGVELTLPYGPASQGARLTFTSGWVTMKVNADFDDGLMLALEAPLPLSEVLSLGRGAHVAWTGSEGQRLVVTARRPRGLESTASLTTTVACEDTSIAHLGLSWPKDADDGAADAGTPRYVELAAGTRAPVSLFAGGPAVETLVVEQDARSLKVLGEDAEALRVRAWLGEARLDGYVPRRLVTERAQSDVLGLLGGLGVGGLGSREGGGQPNHRRCAAEVPLELRLDGAVTPLGTLRKNAAWRELGREGGLVLVALPELAWLTLEPGAAFVLSEAAAAACAGPGPSAGGGDLR